MKPITRKEYYLAKAAGTYTGPTPPPVLREDYYLATLSGDYSGNCPAPVTRLEKYMSAAAGITSYVPQPITRIEKYWYAIAKGPGYVPEPVTREERFLYALVPNKPGPPKPEYVDKTAEGNPILLTDSAEAPLTALTVYGHSTQDGTPSPENPVPIVSAGSVMTTGAQLFNAEYSTKESYGCILTVEGSEFTAIGTVTGTEGRPNILIPLQLSPGTYTISAVGGKAEVRFYVNPQGVISKTYTVTGEESGVNGQLIADVYEGDEVDFKANIMLNVGSTALPWEPYTGGIPGVNPYDGEINVSVSDSGTQSQTLTLSTPTGLPGIPVSSGGNYTDENGQQWICDEIDLARGKYVQYTNKILFEGNTVVINIDTVDIKKIGLRFPLDAPVAKQNYIESGFGFSDFGVCDQLVINAGFTNNSGLIGSIIGNDIVSALLISSAKLSDEATILTHLSENPMTLIYALATPIETDLPAEEIADYKALHTYTPNTTVSNDAEAWMKVGYKANQ